MKTSTAINGFIASEPKLTFGDDGKARFYARVGINHFDRLEDGTFKQLEPTFHDLIQFDKGAQRSADLFVKGDNFIAQGRVNTGEWNGQTREQFMAVRIAHDPNVTDYTVQRKTPSADRDGQQRDSPGRDGPQAGHEQSQAPSSADRWAGPAAPLEPADPTASQAIGR